MGLGNWSGFLREVEWEGTGVYMGDLVPGCPSCEKGKEYGHAPDCKLAAALGKKEGTP